ncbi:MAG: efflux transporter outer membrane subunit [Burkholderiaceae bacterium]|jgi:multidrug efflux system outer membrane protein
MNTMFIAGRTGLLSLAVLVAACSASSGDRRPDLRLPDQWGKATGGDTAIVPTVAIQSLGDDWWRVLQDRQLDRLIDEALRHNADIALAASRVEEVGANLGSIRADIFPVFSASLGGNRTRSTQAGTNPLPPTFSPYTKSTRATLNAAWEVDLWGRLRNATEAARGRLLASEAARRGVRLAVTAQTAQLYFSIQALQQQESTTRATLEGRQSIYELQKQRLDAGLSSELEYKQSEAELAAVAAQLPQIAQQRATTENALRVLLGRDPDDLFRTNPEPLSSGDAVPAFPASNQSSTKLPLNAIPLLTPAGLPAELLLRRPDLQEAEQLLQTADADLAAARAAFYPQISLTGFLGSESADLSKLFTEPSKIFQIAGALAQPIFQGGKLRFFEKAARARQEQALTTYQSTIRNAFRDVADALVVQTSSRERLEAERRRAHALEEAVRLAQLRYDQGISSQIEILDAQRNFLQAQLNFSNAWQAQRMASIDLIKALGGGWRNDAQSISK